MSPCLWTDNNYTLIYMLSYIDYFIYFINRTFSFSCYARENKSYHIYICWFFQMPYILPVFDPKWKNENKYSNLWYFQSFWAKNRQNLGYFEKSANLSSLCWIFKDFQFPQNVNKKVSFRPDGFQFYSKIFKKHSNSWFLTSKFRESSIAIF